MTTTYDVAAFLPQPPGPALQQLAGPTNSGQLVSGGNRLAQRFTCRLLCLKGSIPYLPNQGTNFLNFIRVNGLNTEQDIMTAFAGAMLDLVPQLQAEDANDPPIEQFKSASLKRVVVADSSLTIVVNIVSKANTVINTTIPLDFLLQ